MPALGRLEAARAHVPALVAYVLGFGMPLGVALGIWGGLQPQPGQRRVSVPRALIVGGLAGVIGGWALGTWMAPVNFLPRIAGLVHSDSRLVGVTLHVLLAVIVGASFGLVFQQDVRGDGSTMGWGMAYGLLWWCVGPLTIKPLWPGQPPDWSYARGAPCSDRWSATSCTA